MIKHFCDVCGTEVHGNHAQTEAETVLRSADTRRPYQLQVVITITGQATDPTPELCSACVFQAVDQINPHPREAATDG